MKQISVNTVLRLVQTGSLDSVDFVVCRTNSFLCCIGFCARIDTFERRFHRLHGSWSHSCCTQRTSKSSVSFYGEALPGRRRSNCCSRSTHLKSNGILKLVWPSPWNMRTSKATLCSRCGACLLCQLLENISFLIWLYPAELSNLCSRVLTRMPTGLVDHHRSQVEATTLRRGEALPAEEQAHGQMEHCLCTQRARSQWSELEKTLSLSQPEVHERAALLRSIVVACMPKFLTRCY